MLNDNSECPAQIWVLMSHMHSTRIAMQVLSSFGILFFQVQILYRNQLRLHRRLRISLLCDDIFGFTDHVTGTAKLRTLIPGIRCASSNPSILLHASRPNQSNQPAAEGPKIANGRGGQFVHIFGHHRNFAWPPPPPSFLARLCHADAQRRRGEAARPAGRPEPTCRPGPAGRASPGRPGRRRTCCWSTGT